MGGRFGRLRGVVAVRCAFDFVYRSTLECGVAASCSVWWIPRYVSSHLLCCFNFLLLLFVHGSQQSCVLATF